MEGAKGHRGEIVVVDNNPTIELRKSRKQRSRVVFEPVKFQRRGIGCVSAGRICFVDAGNLRLALLEPRLMKRPAWKRALLSFDRRDEAVWLSFLLYG